MALTTEEVDLANQSLDKIGANNFTFAVQTNPQGIKANLHFVQTRNALLRSYKWPFAKTRLRLVSAWLTDTIYTTDQYVWQSALLYKCAIAHTSDVFATDLAAVKWVLVSTVDAWVTATAYALGETVVNNAILYQCILAHTSGDTDDEPGVGATTATYWVVTTTKPTNVFGYNYDTPANSLRLVQVNAGHVLGHHHNHGDSLHWTPEANTILTDLVEVDIVYVDKITTTTEWDALFTELFIALLAKKLLSLPGHGPGTASLRDDLKKDIKDLTKDAKAVGGDEENNAGDSNWNNARFRGRTGVNSERFW